MIQPLTKAAKKLHRKSNAGPTCRIVVASSGPVQRPSSSRRTASLAGFLIFSHVLAGGRVGGAEPYPLRAIAEVGQRL